MTDPTEKRIALWASPQSQPRWWLARAVWGVVWWGLPFFLLWAVAARLLGGGTLDGATVVLEAVLSVAGGALFGLVLCAAAARCSTVTKR